MFNDVKTAKLLFGLDFITKSGALDPEAAAAAAYSVMLFLKF